MKYVHTNIITDDWKRLAQFYIQAFACKMTLPQRNLSGEWLSRATGVHQAALKGAHLRLPGWGNQGPTLEIFQYVKNEHQPQPLSNRKGLGHLAFEVDDVEAALEKALAFGGERYGEVAVHEMAQLGTLTVVYLRDPDGNIIELQNWGKPIEIPTDKIVQKVPAKHTTDNTPPPLKEDPTNPPTEQELPTPTTTPAPVKPSADWQAEDDLDIDPALDKRAFLDALQKDLDETRQSVDASKAEIKASKEALKYNQQLIQNKLKYTPNEERTIKKDKQELLQELKGDIEKEDLEQRALPSTQQDTSTTRTPAPTAPVTSLALPQTAAKLQVELRIENTIQLLELTEEQLDMAPTQLASNLRALTTVLHPKSDNLSFLEYLGKQYRADLVPLMKALKHKQTRSNKEEAWVMVPRLIGSIQHLLEQCSQQEQPLKELGLEQLALTPEAFVATYNSLLKVAQLAEQKAAPYVRFSYSVPVE